MKNSYITVTDQFCGAGGSSQGVRSLSNKLGGGVEVKLALNHWKLAIETHQTNFQDTLHDCTDISACDPRRYPSTDILITSPECTNHSVSNGKKKPTKQFDMFKPDELDAAGDRSRATMWDVVRFAEYHNYNAIITENVVDARKWVLYDSWIIAMQNLGYDHKCCFLNSMHFWPTPQSRDRMYVVFWKRGNKAPKLDYTPLAHCPKCECNVNGVQSWKPNQKSWKYRAGYVYCCPVCSTIVEPYYYAAFNCIDWSIPGRKIGDRKHPLKGNTERRIRKGIKMFHNDPFLMLAAYSEHARGDVRSLKQTLYTQTTGDMQGVVQPPFIVNNQQSDAADNRVRSAIDDVLFTSSTQANVGIVAPPPFIIKNEHSSSKSDSYIRSTKEALSTATTFEGNGIVTQGPPMIVELNSTGKAFHAGKQALSTLTAGGNNQGLVTMPVMVEGKGQSTARSSIDSLSCLTTKEYHGILTDRQFQSFLTYQYGGSDTNSHITRPGGSFVSVDSHALVNYQEPNYEDCYYRTLKAHEVKLGMDFDQDYIILGDSKAQVRQCGNAVTPPVMEWLISKIVETFI
jgi:DNA (cytosine-5)-methyltransferase 1